MKPSPPQQSYIANATWCQVTGRPRPHDTPTAKIHLDGVLPSTWENWRKRFSALACPSMAHQHTALMKILEAASRGHQRALQRAHEPARPLGAKQQPITGGVTKKTTRPVNEANQKPIAVGAARSSAAGPARSEATRHTRPLAATQQPITSKPTNKTTHP